MSTNERGENPAIKESAENSRTSEQAIQQLLEKHGVKIANHRSHEPGKLSHHDFFLGVTKEYDENDREYTVPRKVGESYQEVTKTSDQPSFDANTDTFSRETKRSISQIYILESDLKQLLPQLVETISSTQFFRVIETDDAARLRIYTDLTKAEAESLQRQAEPLANGTVAFGQGEWVLVNGNDPNHKITSSGRASSGCRYWVVYDSVQKNVAATHLDFLEDEEAVKEMIGHLVASGSQRRNIQLFGSDNVDEEIQQKLKRQFPNATFDINTSFIFNAQTGEFSDVDDETQQLSMANAAGFNRVKENFEIRRDHMIPQVQSYRSPEQVNAETLKDSQHLVKNEHWSLAETTEADREFLATFIGESGLNFLAAEGIPLFVQKRQHSFFGEVTVFYFETHGRAVELIHKAKDPNRVEVAYSFISDFLSKDTERYSKSGDVAALTESMQFIKFLMGFFSSLKKDAPLVFRTFDPKRRKLVSFFVENAQLSNVEY